MQRMKNKKVGEISLLTIQGLPYIKAVPNEKNAFGLDIFKLFVKVNLPIETQSCDVMF